MQTQQHQIWVDLTDMLLWRGHFTGIQRVVYEYSQRLAKDGARFCAFDKIDQRFFEVDQNILDLGSRDVTAIIDLPQRISIRTRIRKFIGTPYYALSVDRQRALAPTVQYANYLARTIMYRIIPGPKGGSLSSRYRDLPDASFSEDDMLVLPGAGWNEPHFARAVEKVTEIHKVRICQHVNDMLPIYQPQLFSENLTRKFTEYIKVVLPLCNRVTVISEATKRDIQSYLKDYALSPIPIHVLRLGDDGQSVSPERPKLINAKENFILSVGTFEIRKNYLLLYQVSKLAQTESRQIPRLIIVGKRGWLTEDLEHVLASDPFASQQILWISDASDNEVEWLYRNCMFTIFPSIAEGWGLPVAESLRHGKFCLSSGTSSMLEIGDGLVDYFLPYDPRECLEKILYYLHNERYIGMNNETKSSYHTFSWSDSYAQMRDALR